MLYAIGQNINKYRRFLINRFKHLKKRQSEKSLEKSVSKNRNEGIWRSKTRRIRKSKRNPMENQIVKTLNSIGFPYFLIRSSKIGVIRPQSFFNQKNKMLTCSNREIPAK